MKDSVFQKRFERKQQNRQVHGQQLTVFYRDMVPDFPVSGLVKLMLRRCEDSVSPGLYRQMANSLVGFEEALQVEMADCHQGHKLQIFCLGYGIAGVPEVRSGPLC